MKSASGSAAGSQLRSHRDLPESMMSLLRTLPHTGAPIDAVILYACDLKIILDRITGRWSCPKCGRVYHIYSVPPKVAGICDDCAVALTQRADDSEPVVRRRFEIYTRQTKPLAKYYEQQGKLALVDAALSPDERFAKTVAALN